MRYGQITETEARTRGLIATQQSIATKNGLVFYSTQTTTFWYLKTDLPHTPAPPWAWGKPIL